MEKSISRIFLLTLSLLLTACASKVVTSNPTARKDGIDTFQLARVDFDYAVKKSIDDFMLSPWLDAKKGERWVVQIGNVRNETTQELDTRKLTQNLMRHMTRSGRFAFTSVGGSMADSSVKDYRQLDNSDLYDQDSGSKGKVLKPHLSMIGEIQQSTVISADRSKQQLEYEFRLRVTDLGSGLIVFDSLVPIDKLGSNKNFTW